MGFPFGVIDFIKGRLLASNRVNYVEVKAPSTITQNHTITLPGAPPSGTKALNITSAGQVGYFDPASGVGSVTSVGLTAPNTIFSSPVAGSPVTTSGTLDLQLATQTINRVLASPSSGSSGVPTFRGLVPADFATLPKLNELVAPTDVVNLNGQRIINLADPVSAQDAATKGYADALSQGLRVKRSVRVATTANIALSGTQIIDGIGLASGDRVLVSSQNTASENGIYIVQTSTWVRAEDANSSVKLVTGSSVFIDEGTLYKDTNWVLITDSPIILGTTPLTFTINGRAGEILDGNGLIKTGNRLDVASTNLSRIIVNADGIDLAPISGLSPGTYSQVTVDAYGRVTLGANPGHSRVARTSFTNSNLASGQYTFAHNLGERIVSVQVIDNSYKQIFPDEIIYSSTTQCIIDLNDGYAPITGIWFVIAVG